LGGFGFTSAVQTAAAAYIASVASVAAVASTTIFTPYCSSDHALPADSLLHRWLAESLEQLTRLDPSLSSSSSQGSSKASLLPSSTTDFITFYRNHPVSASHLQRKLVQQAAQHRFDAAIESARECGDTARVAHLTCISAPHASTWKTVIPSSTLCVLADPHYRIAARLNLGLPPYRNQLPSNCTSCGVKDAIRIDRWHHLSCNIHKRREINLRHNTVVHALYAHAGYAGGAVAKEPSGLSTEDNRRPDLQIVFPGQHILTDVVISHPLCPSHITAASKKHTVTAQQAEQRKHVNYHQLAEHQHARFLPFSVETTGGMGCDAVELVDQISLACRDHLTLESHLYIARGVRASVAIAVQKGNALAILAGYSRAVMRGGYGHVAAA
jgi:hypothetical protein